MAIPSTWRSIAAGAVTLLLGLSLGSQTAAADWRQFRGSDSTAVASEAVPTNWNDAEALAWKVALPGRGLASPIIVGDRVFVTASSGYRQDRLHILCFDAKTGTLVWERQFWATGRTVSHPKTCNAAPTPASDGQRLFALFSSNDLICVDLNGQLQWVRGLTVDYPNASNSLGMSSSPIIVAGTLVAQVENDSQSVAVGIDPQTGVSRWSQERPKRANWTSPAVLRGPQPAEDLALLQSSAGVAAVRPVTGEVVWTFSNGASTIPSSTVHDGTIFVPSRGITALQMSPGSANPEVLWNAERLNPGTATPIFYEGRLLFLNNAGVLVCADPKNGDVQWQQRLDGRFSGSPVCAGGHLFVFNEAGVGQVVKLGDKGEIVAQKDLGETILSTPAIGAGGVFIRSDGHLFRLGSHKPAQ